MATNSREQKRLIECPRHEGDASPGDATVEDPPVRMWVEAAQSGDRAAMERLIGHFQDRVWRRSLYWLGDADEAWDVAQEVFVLCFRKIGQFRGEAGFATWLLRITDNQVKNRLAWWKRRGRACTFSLDAPRPGAEPDAPGYDPPDPAPSPRRQVAAREELDRLNEALGTLPPEYREVLLMRFADEMSYEQIAKALDTSLGTVKSRISRGRRLLAEVYAHADTAEPGAGKAGIQQ